MIASVWQQKGVVFEERMVLKKMADKSDREYMVGNETKINFTLIGKSHRKHLRDPK